MAIVITRSINDERLSNESFRWLNLIINKGRKIKNNIIIFDRKDAKLCNMTKSFEDCMKELIKLGYIKLNMKRAKIFLRYYMRSVNVDRIAIKIMDNNFLNISDNVFNLLIDYHKHYDGIFKKEMNYILRFYCFIKLNNNNNNYILSISEIKKSIKLSAYVLNLTIQKLVEELHKHKLYKNSPINLNEAIYFMDAKKYKRQVKAKQRREKIIARKMKEQQRKIKERIKKIDLQKLPHNKKSININNKQSIVTKTLIHNKLQEEMMKYQTIYEFDKHMLLKDINTIKKNTSGIYVFWDKDYNVLYIGKAKDLNSRLHAHKYGTTHTKEIYKQFYAVSIMILNNYEEVANFVEKDLIKTMKPIYNVIHNKAS